MTYMELISYDDLAFAFCNVPWKIRN